MKDALLYEKAITWAKRKGFNNLKANAEDYESPSGFTRPGEDSPIVPDLTGISLGCKNYVVISLKVPDKQGVVSKWKLFSTMASMKKGKLYLLAPKGHKAFTENLVKKYNVNAIIVSI